MKKVFWLVLGSVIALTACDDRPKTSEQTKTTVENPTQKVASINYKQIALDKSLKAKEAVKVAMQKQEEAQVLLKQGGEDAQRLAKQKMDESNAAADLALKLSEESKAASTLSVQLSKEAEDAADKANQ